MTNSREYRFFYHYNKHTGGMTIHFKKQCVAVNNVNCFVPTFSKWNKVQPRLVMQGWAKKIMITKDKIAIIK